VPPPPKFNNSKGLGQFVAGFAFTKGAAQAVKLHDNRKFAFTLAEVLITIGVIGIIAAMTLPSLIEQHEKKVTAAKLKKFYTVMQQAIMLSEKDNGDLIYWMPPAPYKNNEVLEKWYNTYLDQHIKSLHKEKINPHYYQATLADGSGFIAYHSNNSIEIFYCTDIKYCSPEIFDGRHSFLFTINPDFPSKLITSLTNQQNWNRQQLLNDCEKGLIDYGVISTKDKRHACARLIQTDGWEIKPDYPWRQTIIKKD